MLLFRESIRGFFILSKQKQRGDYSRCLGSGSATISGQPVQHLMVPLPVPPDLLHPEPGVRFRHHIILASLMSVPEASVHQNTGAILPEHNIRFSRQPWMIEPIPESPTPQKFPDKNLRFGIPALDCRHIVMALFYGQAVRHTLLI